jgi:putative spermidine/putrescine transport system ATP-binding protein
MSAVRVPSAGTDSGALVRFVGVHKTYDGVNRVVDRLDLDIVKGEFLTLLGPSGSGKTTTLMLLAGFEVPTEGEILLEGRAIGRLPPHKREIGMVFQHYALFPHMTVAENVAFPLTVRGLPKDDIAARVGRALSMVQLAALAGRRPAQLSGGQQQRVAVARALVFEPKLVLMDEPLGALDKQLREQMQLEIRRLHRELGVTMVYVTHDQSEALTMSDRIAVFRQGRIEQIGTPEAIYDEPANAFVARFIGENNRVVGTVVTVDGGHCTVRARGGALLAGTCAGSLAPGEEALVSIRPEQIVLGEARADCALDGTLAEAIYLGDHLRLRIAVPEMGDIVVKSQAERAFPVGAHVRFGWQARDCRVFRLDDD